MCIMYQLITSEIKIMMIWFEIHGIFMIELIQSRNTELRVGIKFRIQYYSNSIKVTDLLVTKTFKPKTVLSTVSYLQPRQQSPQLPCWRWCYPVPPSSPPPPGAHPPNLPNSGYCRDSTVLWVSSPRVFHGTVCRPLQRLREWDISRISEFTK